MVSIGACTRPTVDGQSASPLPAVAQCNQADLSRRATANTIRLQFAAVALRLCSCVSVCLSVGLFVSLLACTVTRLLVTRAPHTHTPTHLQLLRCTVAAAAGVSTSLGNQHTSLPSPPHLVNNNTWGEVASHNLWPRYDRHFVGITWHNVWSKRRRFIALLK